jgi:hypothetical protein
MDPPSRLGKSGDMTFSGSGAGVAASAGRRLRDPRFVYDPRQLAEFDLPKLAQTRPTTFMSHTKHKATQESAASKAPGEGTPPALADSTGGTLPLIHDPSKGRFRVTSGTFSAVREAYGVDESKRQEAEELASTILAKTYGQQRGVTAKPPSPRPASVPAAGASGATQSAAAKSDELAAAQAMVEVESLRTGEC